MIETFEMREKPGANTPAVRQRAAARDHGPGPPFRLRGDSWENRRPCPGTPCSSRPSANRVYADGAGRLSRAELTVFAGAGCSTPRLDDIGEGTIGGVGYLTFGTDDRPGRP